MEHVNTFQDGMNKDLSKSLFKGGTYVHAENFSLITDVGLSTASLRNIKGNEKFINIPDCSNVVEITGVWNTPVAITITIDSAGFGPIALPTYTVSNIQELGFNIQRDIVSYLGTQIGVSVTATRIIIYGLLDNTNTVYPTSIIVASTSTVITINNNHVPFLQGSDLKILGWGLVREKIVLLTTNTQVENPVNNISQIWQVTYDKYQDLPVIKLLYNDYLNLTLSHPIPNPGGVVGNYETPLLQNFYWTDNFNRPRRLNIADPNCMAVSLTDLELMPNLFTGNIIPEVITTGGVLTQGCYSIAYRLKNAGGNKTVFSMPSNPIPLTTAQESAAYQSYYGSVIPATPANTSKLIRYSIYNIDTNYTNIEIVSIYKISDQDTPDINIIYDEPIPANGIFTFNYSGNENKIPISLDEFLELNVNFDTVKTVNIKNNYLFFGNVKYADFDVDFDARAYRFNNAGNTYLPINTSLPNWDIPLNDNAINPNQNPYDANSYVYNGSGVVGGEGPNVKYEFTNPTDNPGNIHLNDKDFSNIPVGATPYVLSNRYTFNYDLGLAGNANEIYPNSNLYLNYKSPYIQANLKGYLRDETYRFGIVFHSKKGENSYVHWVGDIRIPSQWMYSTATGTQTLMYPISNVSNDITYGQLMGIKFTVDVSSVKDKISGYSIVRVKREDSDKTILGQGPIYIASYNAGSFTNHYLTYKSTMLNSFNESISGDVASFNSPDFLFTSSPSYNSGDTLELIAIAQITMGARINADATSTAGLYSTKTTFSPNVIGKYVTPNTILEVPSNNTNYGHAEYAVNGYNIYNHSDNESIGNLNGDCPSYGGKTLILVGRPNNVGDFSIIQTNALNENVAISTNAYVLQAPLAYYIANYKRTVTNQYKGNSFSARSTNTYISTGHTKLIDPTSSTNIYTEYVFGGDTYITAFDNVKQFRNRDDGSGTPAAGSGYNNPSTYTYGVFVGHIIPIETTVNTDWRANPNSQIFNINYLPDTTPITGIAIDEEFVYEPGYQQDNDVMTFFPAPVFNLANDKFDVRVFRSNPKTNGELTDSWGVFKSANYIDIDTAQGELNNLIVFQDKLVAFQDRGISVIAVNDRALTQDANQSDITLGTSGVLARYDYISKAIGSKHQFSFTTSNDAVFWFDINTKNMYKMLGVAPSAISVAKGMSSYFNNNLNGLIQTSDNPYLDKGITTTYDFHYNEAIMSFRDTVQDITQFVQTTLVGVNLTYYQFNTAFPTWAVLGQSVVVFIKELGNAYLGEVSTDPTNPTITNFVVNILENPTIDLNGNYTIIIYYANIDLGKFTIAYNDFIDAYTSFYSFVPSVYVNDLSNIFSPSSNLNDLYLHDINDHGVFYDSTPYPSKVTLLINPSPADTKIFDNYEIVSESIDLATGVNEPNDLFNKIRLYNDYQNTDFQFMPLDTITGKEVAKRKERTWNISNLRNRVLYTTANPDIFTDLSVNDKVFGERMRDKYMFVDLIYNNRNNYRYIFHSFKSSIRKSAR